MSAPAASPRVVVVDYGVGNVGSVVRALAREGAEVVLTGAPDQVAAARRVVLPGVGAFAPARERLAAQGLEEALRASLAAGGRLLGLCLGFQLLFESSAEFGRNAGLGLLAGSVEPFPEGARTPHVGWNRLEKAGTGRLLDGVPDGTHVYFVHSFRPEGVEPADVAAWCDHGGRFAAAVEKGNVWGCQFHPEKSSGAGRAILRSFLTEAAS